MSKEQETKDTGPRQLVIRFDAGTIDRIEDHVTRMRRASPGVGVTRTDAIRTLVIRALDLVEQQEQKAAATKS